MNAVAELLTNLLPAKARPYAKSVYPFVATIVTVVVAALVTHQAIDTATLSTAIGGLVMTILAFLAPNKPAAPVVAPAPAAPAAPEA